MTEAERLQKVLAHAGVASRRAVETMIDAGRVRVNGAVARLGQRVDPSKDVVEVDGSRVPLAPHLEYWLVNKPAGVITTARDPGGRPTILELVDTAERLWPVGRLDADTEGIIVVTNDGDLTNRLTHPRYGVAKTYAALVEGGPGRAALRALASGVELEDGRTAPAQVSVLDRMGARSLVEITVTEGRNRLVRRMFAGVGHPVERLTRVAIGPVVVGRLKPGTARRLSADEVRALYRAGGIEDESPQ